MDYKSFLKLVDLGMSGGAYLFLSKENYLCDQSIEYIADKYFDKNSRLLNFYKIQESEDISQLIDNYIYEIPFFAEKRLIVIYKSENSKGNINSPEFISKILKCPKHTIAIIVDKYGIFDKRTKIYKEFTALQRVVEFNKVKKHELERWLVKKALEANKKLSSADAYYVIDSMAYDSYEEVSLYNFISFIEKIKYLNKSESISRENINKVIEKTFNQNIFQLINALHSSDIENAIYLYNELLDSGENEFKVLIMLGRNISFIIKIIMFNNLGMSYADIQKKLGVKEYEYRSLIKQAGLYTLKEAEIIYEAIRELEFKFKSKKTDVYTEILNLFLLYSKKNRAI